MAIVAQVSQGGVRQSDESGTICPEQFNDLWAGAKKCTGEIRLMVAVLAQAIEDLRKFSGGADGSEGQRLYRQARQWIGSNDRQWQYSFVNISEMLNMPFIRMRARLLSEAHPK